MSITPSGTNTAGETYSLVCSVTVTGSIDQLTITWLDPVNNTVPSEMVTTTGNMSTLTFDPLVISHAGTYTCRATLGDDVQTATVTVTVQSKCSLPVSLLPVHMHERLNMDEVITRSCASLVQSLPTLNH